MTVTISGMKGISRRKNMPLVVSHLTRTFWQKLDKGNSVFSRVVYVNPLKEMPDSSSKLKCWYKVIKRNNFNVTTGVYANVFSEEG